MNRILVADGDPAIRLLLEEELWGEGYEVIRIESTEYLLGLVREHRPDLVIADITPGRVQSLVATIQQVRETIPGLPVILFTAYWLHRHTLEALPIDAYVIKSFDLSLLKRAVRTFLPKRKAARSARGAPFENPVPVRRTASTAGAA